MDAVGTSHVDCQVHRWQGGPAPRVRAFIDDLQGRLADPSPYGATAWLLGAVDAGLVHPWGVVMHGRGHEPLAVLPLTRWGVGMLSARPVLAVDVTAYSVDPAAEAEAFAALAAWLRAAPGVGVIDLGYWDDAGRIARLEEACDAQGAVCIAQPCAPNMILNLPESWDAFMGGLSRNARESVRDAEKKLARDYPDLSIEVPRESGRLTLAVDALIHLYRTRWHDRPGGCAFDDPRYIAFFRDVFVAMHEVGVGHISVLRAGGKCVVTNDWFHHPGAPTVHCHLFARDTTALPRRYSPGMAAMAFLIRWAIEHGAQRMSLGSGDSFYKHALGGVEAPMWQVYLARNRAAVGLLTVGRVGHALSRLPVHLAYWGSRAARRLVARPPAQGV